MPKSAADRQRERRRRKAQGTSVLAIEINIGMVADTLIERGLLQEWSSDDPQAVADALARALERWSRHA